MAFWSQADFKEPLRANKWYIEFTSILRDVKFALKECKKPSYKLSETKHRCFNYVVNLPGTLIWDPINIKFASIRGNTLAQDASVLVYNVLRSGGNQVPNTFLESTLSKTRMHNALEAGLLNIIQVDADGSPVEVWSLYNAYISVTDFGSLSYENENIVDISCTITYDWAELNNEERARRLGIITQPPTPTEPPAPEKQPETPAQPEVPETEKAQKTEEETPVPETEKAETTPEASSEDARAAAESNLSPTERAERNAKLAEEAENKAEKAEELSQKYRENPTEANRLAALAAREDAAAAANEYRNTANPDGQPVVASSDLRKQDVFREDVPIPEEKREPAQVSEAPPAPDQAAAEGDKLVTVNYNGVEVQIKASEADDLDTSIPAAEKAYQNKMQQTNKNTTPPEDNKLPTAEKNNEPPVQERTSSAGEPTQQEKDDAIKQAKEAVAASRQNTKDQEDSARAQRAAEDKDEPPIQEKRTGSFGSETKVEVSSTGSKTTTTTYGNITAEEVAKGEQLLEDVKGNNKRSSQQSVPPATSSKQASTTQQISSTPPSTSSSETTDEQREAAKGVLQRYENYKRQTASSPVERIDAVTNISYAQAEIARGGEPNSPLAKSALETAKKEQQQNPEQYKKDVETGKKILIQSVGI